VLDSELSPLLRLKSLCILEFTIKTLLVDHFYLQGISSSDLDDQSKAGWFIDGFRQPTKYIK